MAKGNLFLGDARGSVGDVTFYTKNGQQISRVRRRSIKNPNTSGQLYQRAILSTVIKAYQAGSVIFDHSFEGVATGAASQARFQKVNIDLIRKLVEADIASNASESEHHAAVVPRGSVWPVPNVYRVSQGTLFQNLFTQQNPGLSVPQFGMPDPIDNETVAGYLQRNGIIDDDIFTFVGFGITGNSGWRSQDGTRFRRAYETQFGWIRLRVQSNALVDAQPVIEAVVGDVFDVESSQPVNLASSQLFSTISLNQVVPGSITGSLGVIRSRENSGLRSTCDMVLPQLDDEFIPQWGIIGKYIPEFWSKEIVQLGQSPLILEGGSINVGR